MTLDKDFEWEIVTEGVVDTPDYRYVYRSYPDKPCIERIERRYLGTAAEEDSWETVSDRLELGMARNIDLYCVTQHEYAAVIHQYNNWIEDVGCVDETDLIAPVVYEHIGKLTMAEFLERYSEEDMEFIKENYSIEPMPEEETFDCWELNSENDSALLVFPESWV